jgi:hypothetical protein
MGLSIDKVFRFVQFVANKETRGWITPADFNLAAELAQLTLYSEKEGEYAATKKLSVDMRPFLSTAPETPTSGIVTIADIDVDFRLPIKAWVSSNYKPVKEVKIDELAEVMDSEIIAPSVDYPVVMYDEVYAHIYPISPDVEIVFSYLKKPSTPTWAYTVSSARPIYDAGNSDDFDFDEPMFLPIASRILSHVGVNLKDMELAQFGAAFEEKGQ